MENRLSLNGIDLSGYVSNTELAHDRDDKNHWHERLPGLKDASMSITGTWDMDLTSLANLYANDHPERKIIVQQPDGRWQAVKARLARRWPLRWLKVRWRVYTTRGMPRLDPETGVITVSTTESITVTTVTRRGGR